MKNSVQKSVTFPHEISLENSSTHDNAVLQRDDSETGDEQTDRQTDKQTKKERKKGAKL
jgi:hypothetical protein